MTASTVNSNNIANIVASPISALDRKRGKVKTIIDKKAVVAATSTNEAGDTILFGPIPSNAVILDVLVRCDDLDAHACPTLEGDFGLVYSGIGGNQAKNGNSVGTAIDLNLFADASAVLQAAVTSWTSVQCADMDIVKGDQEAWEAAGLAADPGGILYLSFTVGTGAATGADGDVVVRIDYI